MGCTQSSRESRALAQRLKASQLKELELSKIDPGEVGRIVKDKLNNLKVMQQSNI